MEIQLFCKCGNELEGRLVIEKKMGARFPCVEVEFCKRCNVECYDDGVIAGKKELNDTLKKCK